MDNQLFKKLSKFCDSKTLIVGIGNTLKGDDGAGPLICKQLAGKISAEVIDAGTVPENYIQVIVKKAPANLLVIDAMDFGATAGMIELFKPEQLSSTVSSTHTLSPRLFVDMLSRQIAVDVFFIGIQPAQTQLGQSVSVLVKQAMQRLLRILTDIFPPKSESFNPPRKSV